MSDALISVVIHKGDLPYAKIAQIHSYSLDQLTVNLAKETTEALSLIECHKYTLGVINYDKAIEMFTHIWETHKSKNLSVWFPNALNQEQADIRKRFLAYIHTFLETVDSEVRPS